MADQLWNINVVNHNIRNAHAVLTDYLRLLKKLSSLVGEIDFLWTWSVVSADDYTFKSICWEIPGLRRRFAQITFNIIDENSLDGVKMFTDMWLIRKSGEWMVLIENAFLSCFPDLMTDKELSLEHISSMVEGFLERIKLSTVEEKDPATVTKNDSTTVVENDPVPGDTIDSLGQWHFWGDWFPMLQASQYLWMSTSSLQVAFAPYKDNAEYIRKVRKKTRKRAWRHPKYYLNRKLISIIEQQQEYLDDSWIEIDIFSEEIWVSSMTVRRIVKRKDVAHLMKKWKKKGVSWVARRFCHTDLEEIVRANFQKRKNK